MKIAVFCYKPHVGSFAAVARTLANGLDALGNEVEVWYLEQDEPLVDGVVAPGSYADSIRMVHLGGRARSCTLRLVKTARLRRPDAIISLSWFLNYPAILAIALSRTNIPLLLNEGSSLSYKSNVEYRHEFRIRYLARMARWVYPLAAAVTGASRDIVMDLEDVIGVSGKRTVLRVIPNAVDGERVRALAKARRSIDSLPSPVFINVARHARQKNLPLLIRAFASHLATGGSGSLLLVGEGEKTEELVHLASELGIQDRVHFPGRLANPFPEMATSDVFVLSSEEEGFGLVLVEAMALGMPIISTDCQGGPREILGEDQCGVLVPSNDEPALVAAMQRVVEDDELRRRLSTEGIRRAADFEPIKVAQQWQSLISEVSSKSRGSAAEPISARCGRR